MMDNNVPSLRFKEFSGKWEKKTLGEIANKIGSGKTPLGGDKVYQKYGIPFIRSQNVNNDRLLLDDVYISEEVHKSMLSSKVISNDILLNITGASIGRSCVVPTTFEEGNVNQHVCIIRLRKDNPIFIQKILSSNIGQKLVYQTQTGSGREGLNFESIKNFKLNLPTLAEQEKIANYLSALDEKINLLSEKEKNLAQYKKAMMQKLFAQEIRFKDDEGKAFEDWEDTIGGDIFISHTNKNHDGTLDILAITQEHGAIPRKLIDYSVQVSDESVNSYKVVEKDDFIISLRSFQGGIEHSNYHGICSPAYIILRNKIPIVPLFYKAFFKSKNYINYLNRTLEGIRDGKMISYVNFAKSKLPYPCLAEQEKIANFLSAIDEKINAVQKQKEAMQAFKKAMLQQMFV